MGALKEIVLVDYVTNYSAERNFAQSTVRGKRETLTRFFNYLRDKSLTPDNCRAWVKTLIDKGNQPSSVKHQVRILRATVKFLFKRGHIESDFSTDLSYPKCPRKQLEIIPAELAEQVIFAGTEPGKYDHAYHRVIKEDMRQALRFILRTGLRIRELIDLKPDDMNLEDGTYLIHSKGGNEDIQPLPQDMLSEIKKRLTNTRLFPVSSKAMNGVLKRGSEKLGVTKRVRCHTLRHVFCTTLLKCGVSLQIVSRLMRHSTVRLTDSVYSHYLISDLREALNSKHPLIFQGLSKDEAFDMVERAVRGTGLNTDNRFALTVDKTEGELVIKIKAITE